MDSLTQRLKALSSAEDFLAFFGIAYEERVVQVNRLHILKRFYQYLHGSTDLALDDDIALFRQYRTLLQRAYGDFVRSNAATEKVFKVFQEAAGQKTVSAGSLRDSLAARRRAGVVPALAQGTGPVQAASTQLAASANALQQAT